ncbi:MULTISPECIES: hypothetical protein [unclassified Aquimarina]|uniref:hypothetical protein n=1 Tax=unclassified Aquimarina TaxID=2627091 RepID=UPI000D54F821|nr:hypothetical protein [Aquimarina sp. Aq107]
MEQAIEQNQVKIRKQSDDIIRWEQEEVLLLARHFQKLNKVENSETWYYTRANIFEMNESDIETLNTITDIQSIRVYMSISGDDKNRFTFHPIIKIIYCDMSVEKEVKFTLEAKYQSPKISNISNTDVDDGGTQVPKIFAEMIWTNWNNIEDNLIDDLFVAKDETTKMLTRVIFYDASSEFVLNLFNNTLKNNIERFIVYPGVDMNKFQNRNMISFTPVIGVVPEEEVKTEAILRHGIMEFTDEEIFIEYLTPCPPTCPK